MIRISWSGRCDSNTQPAKDCPLQTKYHRISLRHVLHGPENLGQDVYYSLGGVLPHLHNVIPLLLRIRGVAGIVFIAEHPKG